MAVHVGDVGRALTDLSPSGTVEIDGVRRDARSDGPFVPAGTPVVVVRGANPGYLVRAFDPAAGRLPNHGEVIGRGDAHKGAAEVAREDEAGRLARRAAVARRVRRGGAAAAVCGAVAGMASAGLGWHFDWASEAAAADPVLLFAGSMAAGAAAAFVLFFFTGWFSVHALPSEGHAAFEPDPVAVLAGLVGVALGFWTNLAGGEAGITAAWSVGLGFAFAAVTCGVVWLVGFVTGGD